MIIGLNGRLQSGKDTTFGIIKELYPHAERISFAEKLKESAAASIGTTTEVLEWLKNKEDVKIGLRWPDLPPGSVYNTPFPLSDFPEFTAREYLQWYGTQGHRDIFGDDFWVDQALPHWTEHEDRLIVITDMRFPNEAKRIIDLDGVTAKIVRESETKFSNHASEQNIDHMISYFIDNTGTMEDLVLNVAEFMETINAGATSAYSSRR